MPAGKNRCVLRQVHELGRPIWDCSVGLLFPLKCDVEWCIVIKHSPNLTKGIVAAILPLHFNSGGCDLICFAVVCHRTASRALLITCLWTIRVRGLKPVTAKLFWPLTTEDTRFCLSGFLHFPAGSAAGSEKEREKRKKKHPLLQSILN